MVDDKSKRHEVIANNNRIIIPYNIQCNAKTDIAVIKQ
jgi:hypothetical protein